MLKYNNSDINDWFYNASDIIKVYHNGAVCYYKIVSSGGTTAQTPCYAVVDDISQYSDTEFEDVFNKADEKWYKLNNLNQYEEYGVYGSGRNITYYDGKLTIDDGYEYMYSGSSWTNVGEVSGSTATLPNVPFSVNFNANNYDANTKTLAKTSGQLVDTDAVITAGTPTVHDGYLTIASGTRATISGYQTYFNRDNSNPNLTIISKQRTEGSNCHMFANRDSNYNWMYRVYSTKLTLHGGSETGQLAVSTQPVIEAARVYDNRTVKYNNYTNNTTSSASSFSYGSTNSTKFAMFQGYATTTGENFIGDFYWVYMSQNTLTDDQVQQVIDYNEGGGGQSIYPLYYDEIQDPPSAVTFSSMTEAESMECPYVGLLATIDGVRYVFSGDSTSGYEWVYKPSRLPQGYTEVEYIENFSSTANSYTKLAYINTNFYPTEKTRTIADIQVMKATMNPRYFGSGNWNALGYIVSQEWTIGESRARIYCKYGNSSGWIQTSYVPTLDRHVYDHNYNGKLVIDDVDIVSLPTTSFTCTRPMAIFTAIQNNGNVALDEAIYGRLYSFNVYENDVLIRDLVPCTRDSDSVAGVYDIVNDVFYQSANSNSLIAGPTV